MKYVKISFLLLLLAFVMIAFFGFMQVTSYRKASDTAIFTSYNKQGSSVSSGEFFHRVRWNSSNTKNHFIISPTIDVDSRAYLPLAVSLSNDQYNVNVIIHYFNQFEQPNHHSIDEITNTFEENKQYYVIFHDQVNASVELDAINNDKVIGIIYLDASPMRRHHKKTLAISTKVIDKSLFNYTTIYYSIINGTSDGFANFDNATLKMSWIDQQAQTIEYIMEWINNEK